MLSWILTLAMVGTACWSMWHIAYETGYEDALNDIIKDVSVIKRREKEAESRPGKRASEGVQAGVQMDKGHKGADTEACMQLEGGDGARADALNDR